jgi:hypothetical protein
VIWQFIPEIAAKLIDSCQVQQERTGKPWS